VTPYELIKSKRDGQALPPEDIRAFLGGYTRGDVPDYQMAALLMAVFFRGLDDRELGAWTRAMLESGEVLDLSDVPGVKVDKHSTGGVGDKVSLSLAPLVAACGVPVPMISGRGLGHTGGTLDKLESIPGFRIDLGVADFRRLVRDVGACLIGQTAEIAPADKMLYALRDVTATVDCLPLIASSILSKKLAEGIDALVLDVKTGSGAFMKRIEDSQRLARTIIDLGAAMGRRVVALITDMDQPLGRAVGNSLEVIEAVEMLHGRAPADYAEVTLALAAEALVLGEKAKGAEDARAQLQRVLDSGRAVSKLEEIVRAQGGDVRALRDYSRLPSARSVGEVTAPGSGFVAWIDCEAVGLAAVALGAGRERLSTPISPGVGFVLEKKVGDTVRAGEALVRVHYDDEARWEESRRRLLAAYRIGPERPTPRPLIHERLV
jgi:pyrimidine-nucleoside phosphorylase